LIFLGIDACPFSAGFVIILIIGISGGWVIDDIFGDI
jgi:hypothetical protein